MRILATFPGKYGDLLWALPTIRALSEAYDTPVDLQISGAYGSIAPLLIAQEYIGAVLVDSEWEVQDTAPMTPRVPPALAGQADQVYHLGYEGWPGPTLAKDIYWRTLTQHDDRFLAALDLDRPWITTRSTVRPPPASPPRVWVAWSEEWFELKVGILTLLAARFPAVEFWWLRPEGGRYGEAHHFHRVQGEEDGGALVHGLGANVTMLVAGWMETVLAAQGCGIYLGCLSSQWVLANALGKPVIAVEPNPNRHHPVFYRESPKNHLVFGNDGKPTHDARHVGDALEGWLERWGR